jgi:hypothetical protein
VKRRRRNKTAHPQDDPRLTSKRLLLGAIQFADLADVYASARPRLDRNPLLLTFVLAIALELALKAVLRKDGATEKGLRRIGHDVEAAYRLVRTAHTQMRLRRTADRARVLRLLRTYYREKYLEYTPVGTYKVPELYVLRGMVLEAIRFALDHVYAAGTYRKRLNMRGVRISAPTSAYGNASRSEMRKQERLLFQKLAEALA